MRTYALLAPSLLFVSMGISQPVYQYGGTTEENTLVDMEDTGTGEFSNNLTVNTTSTGVGQLNGVESSIYGYSYNDYAYQAAVYNDQDEAYNYGLYSQVEGTNGTLNIGVYATSSGGSSSTNYSGYFDGDVVVNGSCDPCSPSDLMFKTNIRALDGGLKKIMALQPKIYQMKADEFKNTINLARGDQFGLIAEDVESVLPQLVHKISIPPRFTKTEIAQGVKKTPVKFEALNYKEFIPIMIEAMKEQQAEIDSLKSLSQQNK